MDDSRSALFVFLFTDIVGSVELFERIGDDAARELIDQHKKLFGEAIEHADGGTIESDEGDGLLARFTTVSDAVLTGLRFQYAIETEAWDPEPIHVRIGLHLGQGAGGLALSIASRLTDLAGPAQILMSRAVDEIARQKVRAHPPIASSEAPPQLNWKRHGWYKFQGVAAQMEVYEVGAVGIAALSPPRDSKKAERVRKGIDPWRPAVGQLIPGRDKWVLERQLGAGGFGEVWLAENRQIKAKRAFKFCFNADRLKSLKREINLFRVLQGALGDRPDIAKIHEMHFDKPPFYLESEFTENGSLVDWAGAQGGIADLPLKTRLDLMIGACDAVAAAHSVGVLHKDVKPSNILIYTDVDGSPGARLSDFGIGKLTGDHSPDITRTADAELDDDEATTTLYAPPEVLAGEEFTTQGDVYALGVMLYQMVAGDLRRFLGPKWEADIDDPLLREDIARAAARRPEDRFGSASELADHLRQLDQRRTERQQQLDQRRTERRRRRAIKVAAVVSVVLTVLLAVAVPAYFYERDLRHQRDQSLETERAARARVQAARREAEVYALELALLHAANFETMIVFLGEFESHIAKMDGSIDAREVLVNAALENLIRVREVSQNPRVLRSIARAYEKIGDVYGGMSIPSRGDASAALESYRTALQIRLPLLADDLDDRDLTEQVATNVIKITTMIRLTGSTTEALDEIKSAYEITFGLVEHEGGWEDADRSAQMLYARVLQKTGDNLKRLHGYTNEVRTTFELSLKIRRSLVEAQPDEPKGNEYLAIGLGRLANYWRDVGEYERAVDMDEEALAIRQQLAEDDDWSPDTTNSWIFAVFYMCESYLAVGKTDAADELATECLDLAKERFKANQDDANTQFRLVVAYEYVANVHAAKEDWAKAGKAYARCYDQVKPLFDKHPNKRNGLRLATVYAQLGDVALAQGELVDAQSQYDKSLEIVENILLPLDSEDREHRKLLANVHSAIGAVLFQQESLDEAVGKLEAARDEYQQLIPDDLESALMDVVVREGQVLTLQRLAETQRARGNSGEVSAALSAARSLIEGHPDERSRQQLEDDLPEFLVEGSDDGGE